MHRRGGTGHLTAHMHTRRAGRVSPGALEPGVHASTACHPAPSPSLPASVAAATSLGCMHACCWRRWRSHGVTARLRTVHFSDRELFAAAAEQHCGCTYTRAAYWWSYSTGRSASRAVPSRQLPDEAPIGNAVTAATWCAKGVVAGAQSSIMHDRFSASYAADMHVPHSATLVMRGTAPRQNPVSPSCACTRRTTSHVVMLAVDALRPATCTRTRRLATRQTSGGQSAEVHHSSPTVACCRVT